MSFAKLRFCQLARASEVPYLKNYQAYIGGKWKAAADNSTFPVYNPATGAKLADVSDVGKDDVEEAVFEASRAFQSWKAKTAKERSKFLQKWKQLLVDRLEDIGKLISMEQGKPVGEAEGEVTYSESYIEWFAEEAKRVYGDIIPAPHSNQKLIVMKQPVGVSALWTPWNFPLAMLTRKAAAALAAGCTVVCKPSEDTPLTALALAQLAEEAEIPAGVFNVIPCSRDKVDEVTNVVMDSTLVTKFSFTGSTFVGKLLLKKSADTVKKVSVELGGNAAFIVFDSADVDAAARAAIASKFRNTGQTCISANRIFIQDGIYDKFLAKMVELMQNLVIGNGLEKGTTQGPLINEKAVTKVERHIKESVELGAKVVCGGKRHRLGGSFFELTILRDVTNEMPISQEETFGPVAPLLRFKNEAEAIAMANATSSGLAGYFFSQDFRQIWRVAEALEVGMVGVNSGLISSEVSPFGGVKQSGFGTEGSKRRIQNGRSHVAEYLSPQQFKCAQKMTETFLVPILAGGTAGLVVDITLFPLDTIKTRIQSSQGFLKVGGFRGVYSGIGSAATGSAPAAATFFCTYEITKDLAGTWLPNMSTPHVHMVAASFGELVSNVVRVPFEVVKQRAQTYSNMSSLQTFKFSLQQEGYKGLYRGYWNTVFREVPFSFIQYPLWEFLKMKWSSHQLHPVHAWQSSICGAIAGGIAAALTTPLDVAKTRVMLANKDSPTTKVNPFRVLFMIGSQEGVSSLFLGVVPRVMWISIGGAIFLGIYDETKIILNYLVEK